MKEFGSKGEVRLRFRLRSPLAKDRQGVLGDDGYGRYIVLLLVMRKMV